MNQWAPVTQSGIVTVQAHSRLKGAGGSPAKIAAGAAGRSILGELPETSSIGWPYIIRDGAPAPAPSLSLLSLLLLLLLILLILLHHCPHSHARLASAKGDKR